MRYVISVLVIATDHPDGTSELSVMEEEFPDANELNVSPELLDVRTTHGLYLSKDMSTQQFHAPSPIVTDPPPDGVIVKLWEAPLPAYIHS